MESVYFHPGDLEREAVTDTESLKSEIAEATAVLEAACDLVVENISDDWSTYDKYRYFAVFIALRTQYDYAGAQLDTPVSTAYTAVISGSAVCYGYTVAFDYLCEKANLWSEKVDGWDLEYERHIWNFVKLDSGTYHVDVTWLDGDEYYMFTSWPSYFMLTQDEIEYDHVIMDGTVATGTEISLP